MVIILQPPDDGDPIPLAPGVEDRLGDMAGNVRVNGQRLVQVMGHYRADAVKAKSRKNRQTTLSFQCARLHASEAAAKTFCSKHDADLGDAEGDVLMLATADATAGEILRDAVVAVSDSQQYGLTTITQYQVVGGAVEDWEAP